MTRGSRRGKWGLLAALALLGAGLGADPGLSTIEPAELTRKASRDGQEVAVEDRVRYFQFHPGKGYDELYLKRTPVVFRLPPRLREVQTQNPRSVLVRGVLKREGERWFCDVTALEPLPEDLARVNQAVAGLRPTDADGRLKWARWAEERGKEFQDDRLLDRARQLEGEALRIEADRPGIDPARHWLDLAERARARRIPEPEPSALAHQAFRARLAAARTPADLEALRSEIARFLPASLQAPAQPADLDPWIAPYEQDPAATYRTVPPAVRPALDHRLWADATQRLLEAKAAADPESGIGLADTAQAELPDRPQVARRLIEEGVAAAGREPGKLRLAEVESLAQLYRDRLHQPEKSRSLYRDWLNDQRKNRLRPTDAEGRVVLARQYETLLGDRSTAIDLLREAAKIDPESREIADAFLRQGFRKLNGEWVDRSPTRTPDESAPERDDAPPAARDRSLRGCTPKEVRERMAGNPDRVIRSLSQSRLMEQWIYRVGTKLQYINLVYLPGESQPRVVAHYTRPAGSGAR